MTELNGSAWRMPSVIKRYGLSVLFVAISLAATFLLQPSVLVTPLFFPAILLSAWVGGAGPGLLAALLATLALAYFFLPPAYSLRFDPAELPQLLVFFLSTVLVSSWSAARKRAETSLQRARDELEAKVEERTADLSQSNEQLRTEIAERNRAEETLRRQANLLEQTHDAILVWEIPGAIIHWNHGAEQLYGFSKQEAIGRLSHDLLRTEHPMPAELFEAMIERHGTWTGELTHTTRDGRRIIVESRQVLMREADGRRLVLETNRDITERKLAEEGLREQASLLSLTHDAIFVRDMSDVITYWNRGAEGFYGWMAEDAIGKRTHDLLRTIFPAPFDEINAELLRTGRWEGDLVHTKRDGTKLIVASRWALQQNESGNPVAVLETNNDITERKRAEEEIRKVNEELEQRVIERTIGLEAANKELEAFAYSVSHDLRAPLRHMVGYAELLQKNASSILDEKCCRYTMMILDSAKRMGTLIDDLLAFSRVGRAEIQKTMVSLEQVVKEALSEVRQETDGRNIVWRIGALPEVYGDRSLLRLALINLISNAVKFTHTRPQAEIEIGSVDGKKDEIVVFISDNGVGFDMKYVNKLFGVFQRLHRTEEFEGTGIGLATVQRIIHRHGGRVWAEGLVNKGATFYFSLPKP
jgi:PAS domain S-box-containing protein